MLTVVVSPHLDDAAFSTGGLLARRARDGRRCEVLTLFAGVPADPDCTPLAAELRTKMGSPADPVGLRREEDARAMARLGARAVLLDHLDAVYRPLPRDIFSSRGELEDPNERGLVQRVCEEMAARYPDPSGVELYAPLGVGGHVDHLIARDACRSLEARGYRVAFYEDFPYALHAQRLAEACARQPDLARELVVLDEQDMVAKLDAMACYPSQARLFFGGAASDLAAVAEHLGAIVRGHALQADPSAGMTESFWRRATAAAE